jgi:hypothetical protein
MNGGLWTGWTKAFSKARNDVKIYTLEAWAEPGKI